MKVVFKLSELEKHDILLSGPEPERRIFEDKNLSSNSMIVLPRNISKDTPVESDLYDWIESDEYEYSR